MTKQATAALALAFVSLATSAREQMTSDEWRSLIKSRVVNSELVVRVSEESIKACKARIDMCRQTCQQVWAVGTQKRAGCIDQCGRKDECG
jgi:hypothetical protein